MYKFIFTFLFLITLTSVCFAQWTHQNSGTDKTFHNLHFLNENLGWACGYDGTIVKTTNGGGQIGFFKILVLSMKSTLYFLWIH